MGYLDRVGQGEDLGRLAEFLAQSQPGRTEAASALLDHLSERIADTRSQLHQYTELIRRSDATETEVQRFLESQPWIVGLHYVRARPRVLIPRAEIDFVLERYDGFFDIVELKGPRDQIVIERSASEADERPPPPSAFTLSPPLAKALAQAHLYRSLLDRSRELSELYGLQHTRDPRIFILIGSSEELSDLAGDVLRELNKTLHRVEIIPYDLLGQRTEGLLSNVEHLTSP